MVVHRVNVSTYKDEKLALISLLHRTHTFIVLELVKKQFVGVVNRNG